MLYSILRFGFLVDTAELDTDGIHKECHEGRCHLGLETRYGTLWAEVGGSTC